MPLRKKRNVSPVYLEYMRVREKHADYIVACRLGDFYEVLGDDAVTLANELDLMITSRDCGLESRVPLIGFPYHAADVYFKKIIQKHKIVVMENADDCKIMPITNSETEGNNEITKANETAPPSDELLNRLRGILGDFIVVR